MTPFQWQQSGENCYSGQLGGLQISCRPPRGLQLLLEGLTIPAVLGVEIISATAFGVKQLVDSDNQPEVVLRQDTLLVKYVPSKARNVECDIRWHISPEGLIDLEVSALTPGKWEDLFVQTRSCFPPGGAYLVDEVSPRIFIYRPPALAISYVEFCHPEDGTGLDRQTNDDGTIAARYKLFSHDLEKGVILRGRLRGQLVPRTTDLVLAQAAYRRFLGTPPNLSI